jgi:2,3-bisphosphoglycerate-independent phosphoglycerate mutase
MVHLKKTDSADEDGDSHRKVSVIEHVDELVPQLAALKPNVLTVTGDHPTPTLLRSHSWHELPVLLWGQLLRPDGVAAFGERACMAGGLGHIRHVDLMPLAMAHALRLTKFGA